MKLTFIDSGMLIAGTRSGTDLARRAISVLEDSEREFPASVFVRMDILPKATYYRNAAEIAFYQRFFDRVSRWAEPINDIVRLAEIEAAHSGLNALDALHVATAQLVDADEFITTEKPGKPLYRVTSVRMVSLREL